MIEYDKELILRMLEIWNFEIDELDINNIKHVPMHQYGITTKDRMMLFIENLQVCIGLYVYNDNFGFAAHINPVCKRGDDYELDNNGLAIRCKRLDDLKNVILENYYDGGVIKLGISIGCTPLGREYPSVKMIYDGIDELILDLNLRGIEVVVLEELYAPEFILNTLNGEIILPRHCKTRKR